MTANLLTAALVFAGAGIAHAANPPAAAPAAKTKKAEPAPPENTIAYGDLAQHIGERVVVHTKYKTTRTGVLTQVSNTQLTLSMDAPGGATELTMPQDTILSVALVAAPAPAPQPGTPSAKKN